MGSEGGARMRCLQGGRAEVLLEARRPRVQVRHGVPFLQQAEKTLQGRWRIVGEVGARTSEEKEGRGGEGKRSGEARCERVKGNT